MVIHRIKSIKAEKLALASFGVLFSITLLSGAILVNTRVNADDTTQSDNVTVTVSSACTLSRSAGSGTYSATLNPGQETGDISGSTIKAICNDGNGYSLYAIGYSGDSYTGNNTKMIGTYGNIDTGTSGDNSWWAMKLAPVAGTFAPTIENGFNNYHVVPATFTQVAKLTSATDAGESANGSSVDAFYKVKASTSQVAGTYTGKVKYVLVHPNSNVAGTYTIAFNANGGSGTMASQTAYNFDEVTLNTMSGITAPSGYKFAGWCDIQDPNATSTNPQTTCAGTSYADEGTVPPNVANANSTYNLYAVWKEVPYMQDLTSSSIAALLPNVGDTATALDKRDGQEYTIAKLADDKYWMTENLNLAGGTALSADDTNVTSAYINSFTTSNNLTKTGNTIVLPASSTSGFNTNNYSYVYNSGNKTNCGALNQNTPCYSYYSWDAATLGSGRSISTDNTDAQQSICPKNWRLPTSRTTSATNWQTTSDFYAMAHQYGLDSTTSTSESDADFYDNAGPGTTPNFLLAGRYDVFSFFSGGSYGFYWSSTSYSTTDLARHLNFSSSSVNSASVMNRYVGYSIRCLFSE